MEPAMHNLSILLVNAEQYEEGMKVAERWHQAYHESLTAIDRLAYIYIKMGEFEKAATLIEETLNKENVGTANDSYLIENLEQNLKYCKQKLQ